MQPRKTGDQLYSDAFQMVSVLWMTVQLVSSLKRLDWTDKK